MPITHSNLNDFAEYLAEHARRGTKPPEGSFTKVINSLPPKDHGEARAIIDAYDHAATAGGVTMPFARRYTTQFLASHSLGIA